MKSLIILILIILTLFILNLYIDISNKKDFIGVFFSGFTDVCSVIIGYIIAKWNDK